MSTEEIVALLIEERDRLTQAINILGTGNASAKRRGRPPLAKAAEKLSTPEATTSNAAPVIPSPVKKRKRRKLSAEARARIAAAQKKRWAEFKKK
jgi:hypothetical protein